MILEMFAGQRSLSSFRNVRQLHGRSLDESSCHHPENRSIQSCSSQATYSWRHVPIQTFHYHSESEKLGQLHLELFQDDRMDSRKYHDILSTINLLEDLPSSCFQAWHEDCAVYYML